MRRIDADALKKTMLNYIDCENCIHKNTNEYCANCCPAYDFLVMLEEAPTIEDSYAMGYQDGAEDGLKGIRPQGEWIFEKADNERTDGYICSNCGCSYHTKVPYFSEYNFCPNCGADMRKGGAE